MRERYRYYINIDGIDEDAEARLINQAIELSNQLSNPGRVVFITHSLDRLGWLERQIGRDQAKKIAKTGYQFPKTEIKANHESLKNYSPKKNEIIITLGLGSDDILLLDSKYNDVTAILALPGQEKDIEKWIKVTNAIDIDSNIPATSYQLPSCVVRLALKTLSKEINMSSGLTNSSDNALAKTYLRALKKYNFILDPLEIESLLFKELHWTKVKYGEPHR